MLQCSNISPFECAPSRLARRTFERNVDYELAKQLKDAEFPQTDQQGEYNEHKVAWIQATTLGIGEQERFATCVRIPTLEELLEAWQLFTP